ncbi:putative Cobalt transport protein ATP-binding subunit [Candidatus Zixiibacteriota bacterium]|nr:putative Cobalt transport protein ATP-binding subunit [candidate division Zixibacteria bacterium]
MIRFSNVAYAHPDGAVVLDGVDLQIAAGEKVAVIGRNGSGKTTFALMLNGIYRAFSGEIIVAGLNPLEPANNAALKSTVGVVFQNPDNQLVSTTVEREVAFTLENLNIRHPDLKKRVDEILHFFGLYDLRNRLTAELSGGEKQKTALAAVMVADPKILVLDEPGSYLDESGKNILNQALNRLIENNPQLTVLRITQYAYVTEDYKRLLVFHKGRIVADRSPFEIFGDYELCSTAGINVPLSYRIESNRDFPQNDPGIHSSIDNNSELKSIVLEDVSYAYDEQDSLLFEEINFKLTNNKVYGIVGPSGSGKSTLIQLMAGLLKPLSGAVKYGGFRPEPGRLAVSFQHPERQFFLETVEKEIRFGAENLGLENIDSVAEECYSLAGLSPDLFANRDPFTLSGGEKRRLAFAAILSLQPSFIFFDEPTCGLDADGIELFKATVGRLKAKGVGVIIVSHHGNIVLDLVDEIIPIVRGGVPLAYKKEDFFRKFDYSGFLSTPELIKYQLDKFRKINYFTEKELAAGIAKKGKNSSQTSLDFS